MLNDPAVLEASRVLAQKLSSETGSIGDKIQKAFELILIRKPKSSEKDKLLGYYQDQETYFKTNKALIQKTLSTGEYKTAQKDKNELEAAALMKTCLLLYNLEEAITKT
jgi:hypothetical protein